MRIASLKTVKELELEIAQIKTKLKIAKRSGDFHIESQIENKLTILEENLNSMKNEKVYKKMFSGNA